MWNLLKAELLNTLGGAGGACTLSVGAIWEPADCGGGVPKSKL